MRRKRSVNAYRATSLAPPEEPGFLHRRFPGYACLPRRSVDGLPLGPSPTRGGFCTFWPWCQQRQTPRSCWIGRSLLALKDSRIKDNLYHLGRSCVDFYEITFPTTLKWCVACIQTLHNTLHNMQSVKPQWKESIEHRKKTPKKKMSRTLQKHKYIHKYVLIEGARYMAQRLWSVLQIAQSRQRISMPVLAFTEWLEAACMDNDHKAPVTFMKYIPAWGIWADKFCLAHICSQRAKCPSYFIYWNPKIPVCECKKAVNVHDLNQRFSKVLGRGPLSSPLRTHLEPMI